ncbi:hypothetical protein HanPI659440_Chr06g0243361 [Helianthus annuus]|nr:hypothetical protein HanPI659440_Chr06g0243361 [Helianthus annuus]
MVVVLYEKGLKLASWLIRKSQKKNRLVNHARLFPRVYNLYMITWAGQMGSTQAGHFLCTSKRVGSVG